jgi:adenylate cyclase class 2
MNSTEIELKFPVSRLGDLEQRLRELGFRLDTPRTFESNVLYDTPDRRLRAKGELLRIRQYGDRWIVTHKRHPEDEDAASRFKVRIETESEVADGEALAEKYRREYSHPKASAGHVVIDETPIGVYCELEGPTGWIDQTLVALGVSPGNCLTESYGRLFTAWKQETGSPAENLTFDEVKALELVGG